jgi:predicted O-methyltransferase YrrM
MRTRHYVGASAPPLKIREAFVHASEIDPSIFANPQGHIVLHDPEIFDRCGYATADEGSVLLACARRMPGTWIEIGGHTGWTAAHIAQAQDVTLISLDPEFSHATFNKTGDPTRFRGRFKENIQRCGLADRVISVGKRSEEFLPGFDKCKFDGAFVDGEHEPPFPAEDAGMLLPHMKDDCVVAFHDALSPHVQDGVRVLLDAGFNWRLYLTAQLLAVCWRGEFQPPMHVPDPSFGWADWIKSIGFDRALLAAQK